MLRNLSLSAVFVFALAASSTAQTQEKKAVSTAADLPRFSYPFPQAPSAFLTSDDATFNAFAQKVDADVESILAGYDIADHETQRKLLSSHAEVQMLLGDYAGALATTNTIVTLQDKPEARLTSGLMVRALAAAQTDTGSTSGPAFEQAFQRHYAEQVNALPWGPTQEAIKGARANFQLVSVTLIEGSVKSRLDIQAAKTGALDLDGAERLVHDRWGIKLDVPLANAMVAALTPYIAAHNVKKPDIWAARDVVLTPHDKLTPVNIAVFDSGVDTSLYPGQLFVDSKPGAHSPHGLAFDTQGNLYNGDLQPLTPEQKALYPKVLAESQGEDDLQNGIDSAAAAGVRKMLSTTPPNQLAAYQKTATFLHQWMHGTHVAGIAVKDNPAARVVVVQFNDGLEYLPFAPTVAWAEKFRADFRQVGEYLRDHNVRVVNMSWADSQSEFEQWLSKSSATSDPQARKELAGQLDAVWKEAVMGAIPAAPKTLWVCAAGNSNSNAGFTGDVPASLELPNLVTVGAVDQAGEETSFTSYGKTVVLDADGYQVESFVPGGTRLHESGTSMASPNVANLAAKLIALDPKLTPQQTLTLMRQTADASPDGRLHVINPKAAVALLKQQAAKP